MRIFWEECPQTFQGPFTIPLEPLIASSVWGTWKIQGGLKWVHMSPHWLVLRQKDPSRSSINSEVPDPKAVRNNTNINTEDTMKH